VPKGQRYSDANKARIVSLLRQSALKSPTGDPNLMSVSRQSGATRKTLRTWWAEVQGDAPAPRSAKPAVTPSPDPPALGAQHLAWAARQLRVATTDDPDVEYVAGLVAERDGMTSDTGRTSATKTLHQALHELRRPTTRNDGPLSPEEEVERVVAMPEIVLEAWLRSPELWGDERWTGREG
jgi:transposase-like protein